jgi:protein disulfide-isomerase A6
MTLDKALVSATQTDVAQNLAPTYEQLGDAFGHAKDKVIVAKVDADGAGKPLGQKYGVSGFPSTSLSLVFRLRRLIATALKWFDPQGAISDYEGGRDLDSLANLCVSFSA